MTTHASTSTRAPARRAATIQRGLLALVVLALLAAGPPAALLAFVGNPVPKYAMIGGQLTDQAVIGLLAAVVWFAWAQLMLAVLIEAAAAVRGAPLPRRIPLTGAQQYLARRLVLAVAFLLAGGAAMSATTAAAGPAVAAVAPSVPGAPVPDLMYTQNIAARGSVVAPTAEPGNAVHDRSTTRRAADRADKPGKWYVVKPPHGGNHDTLWDIADRHLGDGLRWNEIYALNKGRTQPGGGELTLPRLIHPGWRLLLPLDATGLPQEEPRRAATSAGDGTGESLGPPDALPQPPLGEGTPTEDTRTADTRTRGAPALAAGEAAERSVVADPDVGLESPDDPSDSADHGAEETTDVPLGALTLGLGTLACAGLTAELARRRRRAQRFRRPGERLRRPAPAVANVEHQLHAANAEITVDHLRDALRDLAATCHRNGRQLPDLHTVQIAPTGATLLFGGDEPVAAAPFAVAGPREWRLDPQGQPPTPDEVSEAAEMDDDPVDPYPALLAVGVVEDSILLINLEAAGTLRILGPRDDAAEILNALAAELGTSTLTTSIDLALTGCPAGLTRVIDRGRARALDPVAARRWAAAHARDIDQILGAAGICDLMGARASRVLSGLWAPAVLVEGPHDDIATPTPATARQGTGLCIVTTNTPLRGEDEGWTLTPTDGCWRLEPAGIELQPQRLDPTRLQQCAELLEVPIEPAPTPEPAAPAPMARIPAPADGTPGEPHMRITAARTAGSMTPSPADLAVLADVIPDAPRPAQPPGVEPPTDVTAPHVLVLGPLEIHGVSDDVPRDRRRRATELITYLALHPRASHHQLDEALWPGVRVSRNTRNPLVSRARRWLGDAPDGRSYLGKFSDGELYALHPTITCDWHDFCVLSKRGFAAGPAGLDDLHTALELVRGRPFLGVDPAAYGWAEAVTQDMISAIIDVAHTLAEQALTAGDHRRSRWAAARGLSAEPCAELLYRDAILAAKAGDDHDDVHRLVSALRRQVGDLDPDDDLDAQTAELLISSPRTGSLRPT